MSRLKERTTLPRRTILTGDATTMLTSLPSSSIDCIVTSPPYYKLRNYQVSGQLGGESDIDAWVTQLRAVAMECARVLVSTGTFWLNLGDSYSTHRREGAARKSLLLGPERLVLALQRDGWFVRNKIVWAKTNTTPSSVRDRLSTKHEVIYLMSRSPRYFFNLDSIRVPHTSKPPKPGASAVKSGNQSRPTWLGPNSDGDSGLAAMHARGITGHPLGKNPGDVWTLPVSQFRGAHFATYPEVLVDGMLRAGCPELRCQTCRRPWVQPLERVDRDAIRMPLQATCECNALPEPGLVLDPFMGSGTTAVVAEKLGRDWLGIELNPDFVALAQDRIAAARDQSTKRRRCHE